MEEIKTFQNFLEIAKPFKGILLDAWGVFWAGNVLGAYSFAKEAMEYLVKEGKIVGILSNATQLSFQAKKKFEAQGIYEGTHYHFLLTSGEMTRTFFLQKELPFQTRNKKFWVWGSQRLGKNSYQAIFENSLYSETQNIYEADFIYLSVPHIAEQDQVDPNIFYEEVKKLKEKNLPMICANPDRFTQEGDPPKSVVRQGSIALLYEQLGGKVFYFGKPSQLSFSYAMEKFLLWKKMLPTDVVMVGDNPETDIRGAKSFGMKAALVTKTGLMSERLVFESIKQVVQKLSIHDQPDFLLEKFAIV